MTDTTANTTDIDLLDHLAVIQLDVKIWSARKKLTPEDLGNAELPPEDLASLGSKRICDPDRLKAFSTLKARAVSVLERNGVRFLSGWAIPIDHLDQISNELSSIRDEFTQAKDTFLLGYEKDVEEWIAKHPQWASIIANSVVGEDYVRSKMGFKWQIFRILPPQAANPADDLQTDIGRLPGTLFDEIAKSADETWHKCYAGKTEITRKALSPLKTILDKLEGLSFMEPRVMPVAELIKTALGLIPNRGAIDGGTLIMLQGLVALLRTPADLLEHAQKILDGRQQPGELLNGFIGAPMAPDDTPQATPSPPEAKEEEMPESADDLPALESCGLW